MPVQQALDSEITGVKLIGSNTIANYSPNCGATGIQNFTNMTADLLKVIRTLLMTMGTCNNNYKALAAWIDFNNDGDFDDPNEQIGVHQECQLNTVITFTVPLAAQVSWTRIRVIQQENASASSRPCNTFHGVA